MLQWYERWKEINIRWPWLSSSWLKISQLHAVPIALVTWTIQSLYVGTTFAQSFDSRVVSSSQVQQRANLKFNKQLRVTTITRAISLLRIMKLDYRWLCAKLREAKVKVKNDGFLFYLIPANHLCERKGLSFTTKHFLEILFQ